MLSRNELLERTGLTEAMLERAIRLGFLPPGNDDHWKAEDVEAFLESLGSPRDWALED